MKKNGGFLILGMSLLIVAFSAYPIGAQQGAPGAQAPERSSPTQPGMQQQEEMQQGTQQRQDESQQGTQQRQDEMRQGMQQRQDESRQGMQQRQDEMRQGMQERQDDMRQGMKQQTRGDAPITIGPAALSRIQEKLNEQGHEAGPVDGLWGPQTAEGVQSFQQAENLSPTGNLNIETLQAMGMDDFSDQQMQQADGDQGRRNAQGAQFHISPRELAQIQQRLNDEGFDVGPVDGMMGPRTSGAIREYQEARNETPTGNVDVNLIENLGLGQLTASLTGSDQGSAQADQTGQIGTQQDEARGYFGRDQAEQDENGQKYVGKGAPLFAGQVVVRQLQEALRETGHDPGQVDGTWGPGTQEAVRSYQQEQQLEPTGNLTVATIQQLMGATGRQGQTQEQPAGTRQEQQPGRVGEQPGTLDQQPGTQESPRGTQQPPGTMQTPAPGTTETPGGTQEAPGTGDRQEPGTGTNQRQ